MKRLLNKKKLIGVQIETLSQQLIIRSFYQFKLNHNKNMRNQQAKHFLETVSARDLLSMKKQVLKQAYDHQLTAKYVPHDGKQQDILSKYQNNHLKSSQSVGQLSPYRSQIKNVSDVYLQGANLKSRLKRQETQRLRLQQQSALNWLANHKLSQDSQLKQQKQQYKNYLEQEMKRKREGKSQDRKQEIQKEKQSLGRASGLNDKQSSFKQFFGEKFQDRNRRQQHYLDYMKTHKNAQKRATDREIMDIKHRVIQMQISQENRVKKQQKIALRSALEQQLAEKQHNRATFLRENSYPGYNPQNRYNTITNPIDYRTDQYNPYVLGQLIPQKIDRF